MYVGQSQSWQIGENMAIVVPWAHERGPGFVWR